jgi:predicted dehydrogenase
MNLGPRDSRNEQVSFAVVLVGFGRAGQIHSRAYRELEGICRVTTVVEPDPARRAEIEAALPSAAIFSDLGSALNQLGGEALVDICVPAKINLELVNTALKQGVRRFLIEKPLGWDMDSAAALMASLEGCEAVYLDTYGASSAIKWLLARMKERRSPPTRITVRFHKDRRGDSQSDRGFIHGAVPSAWMIEGPHMLSIARQLGGDIVSIPLASTFDMKTDQKLLLPDHGGGHARLEHASGAVSELDLSLCSRQNERTVRVELADGTLLEAVLPASKVAQQSSNVRVRLPTGEVKHHQLEDRPMEYCVRNAIQFFAGEPRPVGRLTDGLTICRLVEQMTNKQQFWQSAPKLWKYFGPPLRPCDQDIQSMEEQVARWHDAHPERRANVLLCGVTPEIASMHWPAGTRLWAVEKSRAMIEQVWPVGLPPGRQVIQGEWTKLPLQPGSIDIVIGDGCFTSLSYPELQRKFLAELVTLLRPGGTLIMRFFVQRDGRESPEDIFEEQRRGFIGSFHAMKWRLAMALQATASEGVKVDDVWQTWRRANLQTEWPEAVVQTIDTYRGSDHLLVFTTLEEIRALFADYLEEQDYIEHDYELGERCPILVYAPRSGEVM